MFFTIKRSQSKRFIRFTFRKTPDGLYKSLIRTSIVTLKDFIIALIKFIFLRTRYFIVLATKVLFLIGSLPRIAKRELVRKLIWSRGRLGRPIAMGVILSVSLMVFFMGEFLSGLDLVVKSEADTDYLSSTVDLIPKKEITTTQIPDVRKRIEPFEYAVEGGDSLYSIGAKFKVSTDAIKYVNNLTDESILRVGQKVTIPPSSGLVHTVKSGDTLESIGRKYDVPAQAIADFNYLLDTTKLAVGAELVIPGAKVPENIIAPIPLTPSYIQSAGSGSASPSKSYCVWPTTVRIITQYFSWYHNGVDIATPWSGGMPPLFACTGGTVVRAGWDPWGLGLHVRIDHGNGYETVYGHMSRIDVSYGQRVNRGQVIGIMGSTGRSSGPHVHFMLKYNGVPQNPLSYSN